MSECIVPNWKLKQQRQEVAAGEETNDIRTAHNHPLLPPPPPPAAAYVVPMSNYEVATELTWENGQVAMHGLTGILPFPSLPAANKVPTFVRTGDTLESIVHQATHYKSSTPNQLHHHHHHQQQQQDNVVVTGKNADGNMGISKKKRPRTTSESDHHEYMMMKLHGNIINNNSSSSTKNIVHEDQVVANNNNSSGGGGGGGGGGAERERSACASASATFCRDAAATTMTTWNSFESPPRSFKTSKTTDEDSACHDGPSENRDEEDAETTKDETYRSHSARRSRAAIVHNQSERRRRDRINEKMKALQKLVPNASKTDKASMLDEVIEYLKQLQTQVHMLSTTTRSAIPQIMINHPLAIQQQQQQQQQQQISSLLARMGMGVGLGMGMGMLDMNTLATATRSAPFLQQHHGLIPTATTITPTFVPPHFFVPPAAVHASQPNKSPADAATAAAGVPFSDTYSVYLAQVCQQKLSALNIKQTMNMEFYNKMAALYRQQETNQATQTTSNSSQPTFIQRE